MAGEDSPEGVSTPWTHVRTFSEASCLPSRTEGEVLGIGQIVVEGTTIRLPKGEHATTRKVWARMPQTPHTNRKAEGDHSIVPLSTCDCRRYTMHGGIFGATNIQLCSLLMYYVV